jgi:hypothetical protein
MAFGNFWKEIFFNSFGVFFDEEKTNYFLHRTTSYIWETTTETDTFTTVRNL